MSLYMFLACEEKLEEIENKGIYFDREKGTLHMENEDALGNIVIREEQRFEDAENYTKKKNIAEINWIYTRERAEEFLEYIKNQFDRAKEIEIWRVWMDEVSDPKVYEVSVYELDKGLLKKVFGKNYYNGPECIKVNNY